MANKILVARGTKARIEEIKSTLTVNELVYSTDTGELGVKKANGNIEYFMNATDIRAIVDTIETSKQDKLVAGENITIDENNVISTSGGGSIVDLGSFNDEAELITHAVMNQLPTGHYTCIVRSAPGLILLERLSNRYVGTLQDSVSTFYYFNVSLYGEINEVKEIDLRDLVDVGDLGGFESLEELISTIVGHVESLNVIKADRTYVDDQDANTLQEAKEYTYSRVEIDTMMGDIESALDVILGV